MTGAAWFGAALAFLVGAWLGRRRGDQRAADEALLREAAVDHLGAYVAQVEADQRELKALRAQIDAARARIITPGAPGCPMPEPGERIALLWCAEQQDGTQKPRLTVVCGPDLASGHDEARP